MRTTNDHDHDHDHGFTLVEILIAIVLVGILSAVVVVGISNLTDKGSASACSASLDAAKAGSVVYFTTNAGYPTTLADMTRGDTPALSLPSGVTVNGTVATATGWALTMTPGAGAAPPTFACSTSGSAPAGNTSAACPGSFTGWVGEYYSNRALSGAPALCRDDASLNFDWAGGAPGAGLPTDNFSARWTRTATFTAGTHTFTVGSDDGVRLYVDGAVVLDFWNDHGYTVRTPSTTLTAGPHVVVVEFYEKGGLARIAASWS